MSTPLTHPELQQLQQSLDRALQGGSSLATIVPMFRGQSALLARLSPAFQPALENILERVEAGALFTEESCSFSQGDLAAALQVWLQKADQRLG